jgi:hypothetical protein
MRTAVILGVANLLQSVVLAHAQAFAVLIAFAYLESGTSLGLPPAFCGSSRKNDFRSRLKAVGDRSGLD